jgi:hypothetical protein
MSGTAYLASQHGGGYRIAISLPGISQQHNRSSASIPTFTNVWTLSLFTYGVKIKVSEGFLDLRVPRVCS